MSFEHEESIFKYADQGHYLLNRNIHQRCLEYIPCYGATYLRYRIIESTATVAPPARMGMGRTLFYIILYLKTDYFT